jgi:hypothetical protein
MDNKSVGKLQRAGYVLLRYRDIPSAGTMVYAIMESRVFGVWNILEKCKTKAARDRRLAELHADAYILFDV